MARLSPEEGFNILKSRVHDSVKGLFPIIGKKKTLVLEHAEVVDNLDVDDLRSQKDAKVKGRSWSVPMQAKLSLIDNETGKRLDQQTIQLLSLPKYTPRYSNIIDGQEYQVDNQWRLKSGVYTRVKDNGELQSFFNLQKGRGFNLGFDPRTREFTMNYGTSNIPLQPLMHELGVDPSVMEREWGKEISSANQHDPQQAVLKFYKASTGEKAPSLEKAREHLWKTFQGTQLRPDVTQITLGVPHKQVTGQALLDASRKLLHVSQGKAEPDQRDALMFKELHSIEDFMAERIKQYGSDISRRVKNTIDRKEKVRDIVSTDIFHRPVREMYGKNSLANTPEQTNPLEMVSGQVKTTIMGEGGIKSIHSVSEDAKLIDPSHLGFLDPIHTPEGPATGISLRLPLGVQKRGHDVLVNMYNTKTGKSEQVSPTVAMSANIVLPDQVTWVKGKPKPIGKTVKISGPKNEIIDGDIKHADYVMRDPMQMFSMASNLIPFMPADHPNRSTMAGRHMEQAIPLKDNHAPLVQSLAGPTTFDKIMGKFAGHDSRIDGTVTAIGKDAITIKDAKGKKHEVQLYDHFPLNADKGFLHSTPIVKVGDKVGKGQTIADTNFTQNGSLALGTNLTVGYMPYKGYNFEDGVVISETAAKRLTSEHLYRKTATRDKGGILDKKKFQAYVPEALTRDHADKLDHEGVIKPGSIVHPGDHLIAALRERTDRSEDRSLAKIHKSLVKPYTDASVKWDSDHPGEVVEVIKHGGNVAVHVKSLEPAEIGDKIAGRHGNKGIITKIISDAEMPRTKDGKDIHILMNPTGVPGRTNLGQVLETAAGKIAEKTGKTYTIKNFQPGVDLHDKVSKDLAAHGLKDKEEIVDPISGRAMGEALVGPQHILKLKHQVEKKMRFRAGGAGYAYDRSLVPRGGGPHGAQALGTLGLYSMLAHGAKHNLREMQTFKSDMAQGDDFWAAIQAGESLPAPRPTYAYNKFNDYLRALGVNVKKEGNNLSLVPFTDAQVISMSNGELTKGLMVRAKDLRPEAGGLFDAKITGGMEGTKWSHIKLPEAMPNPLFEGAIQSLTQITKKDFSDVIEGTKSYDPHTGKIHSDGSVGLVGGKAFDAMLGKIDTKKALAEAHTALSKPGLKGGRLDQANKRVKYLQALDRAGLSAKDAYMMRNVPVLPPALRPLSQLPDGTLNYDDLNHMYKGIMLSAEGYSRLSPKLPQEEYNEIRAELYDGLKSLVGIGGHNNQSARGIIDILGGKRPDPTSKGRKIGQPKEGFFQSRLVQRKQDLSMRSTIIPEPALGLDEVGIPRVAAMEIYKPFVVRELRNLTGVSPLEAQQLMKKGGEIVNRALERVVESRPLLLKRDPALHKYSVQAFKPRIVGGKAVQIHPLVTSGFNADFDGDTMAAFVPVSNEAVDEARKMFPSRNLFSPATGSLMYSPTLESQLGLYGLTQAGTKTNKVFKNLQEIESAVRKGDVHYNDQIKVGNVSATAGRVMIAGALPEVMRGHFLKSQDPLTKDRQHTLLTEIATNHQNDYGTVINKLKDLGNDWSTRTAFSVGLADIKPEKVVRDQILHRADAEVAKISTGSQEARDAKKVQIYGKATQELKQHLRGLSESHSALLTMNRSGIKPSLDTLQQIKMSPMLITNAKGEVIPHPVRRSYSEGLDVADYWTSMSGARKGILQKVQSVQEPGYVSKQVMNSVMNNLIIDDDCKTDKGIALPIEEKDVLDRFLAAPIKAGRVTFPAGTLVTQAVRDSLRNNKVGKIVVRSSLRCAHGPGICKKCYGLTENGTLPEKGLNVGVLAGQALGERATQLSMKSFHTGGTAATKTDIVDEFQRVMNLLHFPEVLPGSATLSSAAGKVRKIEKDPAGGHNVYVGDARHYVPQNRGVPMYNGAPLAVGTEVKKGAPLSAGPINPHEMLPLTGIEPVQSYLAGELHGIYGREGIRRRNTEVVVKALTNLTKIEDPGDHKYYLPGDFAPTSYVTKLNRGAPKKKPIIHRPILKGVNVLPHDMQEDWLARFNHERIGQTLIEAAQQGWRSSVHGLHPIPAAVHGHEFGRGKPGEY